MLGEIERAAIAAQLDADVPVLQQTLDDCIPRLGCVRPLFDNSQVDGKPLLAIHNFIFGCPLNAVNMAQDERAAAPGGEGRLSGALALDAGFRRLLRLPHPRHFLCQLHPVDSGDAARLDRAGQLRPHVHARSAVRQFAQGDHPVCRAVPAPEARPGSDAGAAAQSQNPGYGFLPHDLLHPRRHLRRRRFPDVDLVPATGYGRGSTPCWATSEFRVPSGFGTGTGRCHRSPS